MISSIKNQLNISDIVKEFLQLKDAFKTGIHFVSGSEKRPANNKLILINTLVAIKDDETDEIEGALNINIQDQDPQWIEYVSELVQLYVDQSKIDGYHLEFTTEHLFKVSTDLYFKNLKFKFSK